MKPVIGITAVSEPDASNRRTGGEISLHWNYAQAVVDAGGVPLVIPAQAEPAEILPLLDGVLIPGGADIDASNWGGINHPAVSAVSGTRFEAERSLLGSLPDDLPVLGICYGCQLINVERGGKLIQHLPDISTQLDHEHGADQKYWVEPGSKLSEAVGDTRTSGESWHHQAIDTIGRGLKVVARGEDGTIEAVEATDRPWLVGVQWHPERSLGAEGNRKLMEEFVRAAAEYRKSKERKPRNEALR